MQLEMQRVTCTNIVAGKECGKLIFKLAKGIEFTSVVQSNSKRSKTLIESKCPKCGELMSIRIRLPKGVDIDDVLQRARGTAPQQKNRVYGQPLS